jgi:HPt (histidine-containing phosphotransfer) domain-containing protein
VRAQEVLFPELAFWRPTGFASAAGIKAARRCAVVNPEDFKRLTWRQSGGAERVPGGGTVDSALSSSARFDQIDALGGKALLSVLVAQFRQTYTQDIANAAKAAEELDYETLGKLVHRMEGACTIFGATRAVEACHALRACVRRRCPGDLPSALKNLKTELVHLEQALTSRLEQNATKRWYVESFEVLRLARGRRSPRVGREPLGQEIRHSRTRC